MGHPQRNLEIEVYRTVAFPYCLRSRVVLTAATGEFSGFGGCRFAQCRSFTTCQGPPDSGIGAVKSGCEDDRAKRIPSHTPVGCVMKIQRAAARSVKPA